MDEFEAALARRLKRMAKTLAPPQLDRQILELIRGGGEPSGESALAERLRALRRAQQS